MNITNRRANKIENLGLGFCQVVLSVGFTQDICGSIGENLPTQNSSLEVIILTLMTYPRHFVILVDGENSFVRILSQDLYEEITMLWSGQNITLMIALISVGLLIGDRYFV